MKHNRFLTLLAAALILALVLANLAVPSFAKRKLGDVDGDGYITSADARLALRASVKLEALTAEQALAADVDQDTYVTSADARLILRASVKLETLPDVSVGEGEESTTAPEATPTDAETTEPATPTDAETTEPATPTDAETTTEEPSRPEETTAEPENPGIIPPAENNQFDILRSGTYYFTGSTVEDGEKSDLEIAKTPNSLYLGATFNGVQIAILTIGDKVYLVNPKKGQYLDLNTAVIKAELSALGLDVSEFAKTSSFDFSYFPPLDKATRCETTPQGYVKYVFESEKGAINVTMDGKTLICLENAQNGNVYRIDFYSVTDQVPSGKRELTNLKQRSQTLFITGLLS
ncbi:MAG: hypothetical protein IJK89_04105 [Clostridia bacterium]|nr:hypothetical protein [Clostridia bacterium]